MKRQIKIFKNALKFIASVIMYALFSLLILIGVIVIMYFIDFKLNEKKGIYKPPLYSAYVIVSQSMEPSIMRQDVIVTRRINEADIKVGDVITFKSTDSRYYGITITHRIEEIMTLENGGIAYVTKGDNNNVADASIVNYDNILGKVIICVPKIGYIQYFLTRSYGWLFVIVLPCFGIIGYDIIKLLKKLMENGRVVAYKDGGVRG